MRHRPDAPCAGLTLAEVTLAVAVIAALAAIAVPGILASLRAAREARALGNLKALSSAQMSFHASARRFGIFEELFAGEFIPAGAFARGAAEGGGALGGASEVVTDGSFLFSMRFAAESQGITLDADPSRRLAASHRRFRVRLGRVTLGPGGGEGSVLVAEPGESPPPPGAYRPLGT
jgi:hypothetical protein